MSNLKKIFLKNSTTMSLNDRFTYLRGQANALGNVRRMRQERAVQQKASVSNQRLAMQMEQRAKAVAALRIKKRSVRQRLGQFRVGPTNVKARLSLPGKRGRGGRGGGFGGQANVPRGSRRGIGGRGMRRSTSVASFARLSAGGSTVAESGTFVSRFRGGGPKKQFWRGGQLGGGGASRRSRGGGLSRSRGTGRGSGRFLQQGGRGFRGGNFGQFSPRRGVRGGGLRGRGQQQFRGRGRGGSPRGQRGGNRNPRGNRRGRGRVSRGGERGGRGGKPGNVPTREELDLQLDEYMANTKSGLDRDLDQYMNVQPESWD